jgi:hypothetical protein
MSIFAVLPHHDDAGCGFGVEITYNGFEFPHKLICRKEKRAQKL